MNKKLLLGCGIPTAIVLYFGYASYKSLTKTTEEPSKALVATKGRVEIIVTETGSIEALRKVEVKSKVGGRLSKLFVDEGANVTAGQALADIDPTEINSQVEQIRAQLDAVRARYEQAIRGVGYQKDQTVSTTKQAEQALKSAEARLNSAREENRSQPNLTASDVASAEAGLQTAKDNLNLLKSATHPQAIVAAQSGADETRISVDISRKNLERQKRLLDKGFVSQLVVDTAESDLGGAKSRYEQAKKKLELISEQNRLEIASAENHIKEMTAAYNRAMTNRSAIKVKNDDLLAAEAAVKQARAQLKFAQQGVQQDTMRIDDVRAAKAAVVQLENQLRENQVHQADTKLVASMSGVITRKYIEEGELVTPGTGSFSNGTQIVQISDLSKMLVKMSINEVDVHKVAKGLPVELTIDGVKGVSFPGMVNKVATAAKFATDASGQQVNTNGVVQFPVEIIVSKPDIRLRPGMSAKCTIVVSRRENVIRVPKDAVQGDGANATVQVVTQTTKDGKITETYTPRKVVAGVVGDTYTEIASGLKEGEKVKPGLYTGPPRKAFNLKID
ncbi:MAG: efflux RND transporter periplasmic adaptor subunit [Chthonomonadales bacterium]